MTTQSVNIDAYLGAHRTGQAIGSIVYESDGSSIYSEFSTTGWYEAPTGSGDFHNSGLILPDSGGVVAVGVSGTEYKRLSIGPESPSASTIATAVWNSGTRTLTSFGTLVSDIWSNATRTLTNVCAGGATVQDIWGCAEQTPVDDTGGAGDIDDSVGYAGYRQCS